MGLADLFQRLGPQQLAARNAPYARPGGYQTPLSPEDELLFQNWVQTNKVPFDASPTADYDMRGFWNALTSMDPRAKTGLDPNDNRMHFTDAFKTPYHESFSRQSQYAAPVAPMWNELDQLVAPGGRIFFDDRKRNGR